MKFFDMHADIGTDIYYTKEHNLKQTHLPKFYKGDIMGVFTACFFDGKEDWETTKAMVKNCHDQIVANQDQVTFATSQKTLVESDKPICMISCEGLCGIRENAEESVEYLYQNGVRVASLCWNDQNALAAGWTRDPMYGVTQLGKEVIRALNKRKMIIDVSHINEKGFWDVMSLSDAPVIATHSNARELCNHQRNLTDQQIKAIAAKGGVIGLNACGAFVDRERNKQDCMHLAMHARYMADMVGVKHVGCGFDFMDYLADFTDDEMLVDMIDCTQVNNLVEAFRKEGFSEEEIADICFYNVYNFLKENIE